MSANTEVVRRYIQGFNTSDHAQILSCLTDDIEWTVFGQYHLTGKAAYDAEIENENFVGSPTLEIVRMIEQDNVVMAEILGTVERVTGGEMRMAMSEVFVLRDGLIAERRAYVIVLESDEAWRDATKWSVEREAAQPLQ